MRTKTELRENLLDTNVILDNKYLDMYLDLIVTNQYTLKEKFVTQSHHIIPTAIYKHEGLNPDNTIDNLVNLKFKDHVLAHYYLCNCSCDYFKFSSETAFFRMAGKLSEHIDEIDLDQLQIIYEDFVKQDSINNTGSRNGNFGNTWTNFQREEASRNKLRYYQEHPEVRLRLSLAAKGREPSTKGKKAFYSPEGKCVFSYTCPEGYSNVCPEELRKIHSLASLGNKSTTGMICYTDGINNITTFEGCQPEGFYPGKTFKNIPSGNKGKRPLWDSNGKCKYFLISEGIPEGYTDSMPEELRKKFSENSSGSNNGMYGKQHSDETKKKQSEIKKGKKTGKDNPAFGKHWCTDGCIRCYTSYIPEGFILGCKRGQPFVRESELNEYIKNKKGVQYDK